MASLQPLIREAIVAIPLQPQDITNGIYRSLMTAEATREALNFEFRF